MLGQLINALVPSAWVRVAAFAPPNGFIASYCNNDAWHDAYAAARTSGDKSTGTLDRMTFSVRNTVGVGAVRDQVDASYYRSDYFNTLERPHGGGWLLDMTFAGAQGPIGGVLLTRGLNEPDFTAAECGMLNRVFGDLKIMFASAMPITGVPDAGYSESSAATTAETGTLIFNRDGVLEQASAGALALAASLGDERAPLFGRLRTTGAWNWPNTIATVMTRLEAGRRGLAAPSPSLFIARANGHYRVTARWLSRMPQPDWLAEKAMLAEDRMEVTIVKFDSAVARHTRLLLLYGLTAQEIRVARLIAAGQRKADIAAALGIALSTVQGLSKTIFAKMDVSSAAALSWKLQSHP
jgi:DNA-binding CsgD family transcriptional regulator